MTGFAQISAPISNVLENNNGINFKLLAYLSPSVGFS